MGLQISCKTGLKESLKLLNHLNSFLFEQECGELKYFKQSQIETLSKAARVLARQIRNH